MLTIAWGWSGREDHPRLRGRLVLAALLLPILVELSVSEFVELRALSAEGLRARFELPAECEPAVTAMSAVSGSSRLLVLVDCAPRSAFPSHLPGP